MENRILAAEYYRQNDVVALARDLLGKVIIADTHGVTTAGIITETEAYSYRERGCHAYGKKRTSRNAVMFSEGGVAYVYLCYGLHHLFNVVTNKADEPEAVLIRGIFPLEGVSHLLARRKSEKITRNTFSGPGKVTQGLGITMEMNNTSLITGDIRIADRNIVLQEHQVEIFPRIGIDYAGEDARLPWRFEVNKAGLQSIHIGMNLDITLTGA